MNNTSSSLPLGWRIKPTKYIFSVFNGSTPSSSEPSYWNGNIYWVTPEDIGALESKLLKDTKRKITQEGYKSCGTQLVPINSIVLTTRAPVGNIALADVPLCTNQGCKTLVPKFSHTYPDYFYFQLIARKEELASLAKGTTFQELGTTELLSFNLLYPSPSEQKAIADYLDKETAKIDQLIKAKKRLLELLGEKRRALITHAVTRGLNPDVPMRDSGVEWIGEIPKHWSIQRLKTVSRSLQIGPFGSQLHAEDYVDDGIPVINPVHLVDGKIIPNYQVAVDQETAKRLSIYQLENGDVVFARRGEIGRCGVVTQEEVGWLCGSGSLRVRPNLESLDPEYLVLLVSHTSVGKSLSMMSVGTTMENLNTQIISDLILPLPPLSEQYYLVSEIKDKVCQLNSLITITEQTIKLLEERIIALISSTVSGQLKIKE